MLSKTKYVTGVQCYKRLWLETYQPETDGEPDPVVQAQFEEGTRVCEVARGLYPDGVLVDESYGMGDEAVLRTQQLMQDRSVEAIFEGAFAFERIRVRVDVLVRCPRNRHGSETQRVPLSASGVLHEAPC